MSDRDDINDVKRALSDPTRVLEALGLMGQGKARARQSGGWLVRCPMHIENSPSCSVQQKDGVILWKCWGCDSHGDVLHLVAAAHGLKLDGGDFKRVLIEGARLGGLWNIVDRLEGRAVPREAPMTPSPLQAPPMPAEPPREWPSQAEVDAMWAACGRTANDPDVASYLESRALSPEMLDELDLARALPLEGSDPWWAGYKGDADHRRPWRTIGFRLIVPMFDVTGAMRSVRACRVSGEIGPKRLPPGGHKASEMVMADSLGCAMLRGEEKPYRIVIVEGEPDFLSRVSVSVDAHAATLGIVSGSWTREFAEKIPLGAHVAVRTDVDAAGNRYWLEIEDTLRRRAHLSRLQA